MIAYVKFIGKRVLKRRSNICVIAIVIGIVCVFLIMNIRTQNTFKNIIEEAINTHKKTMETYEVKLTEVEKNSDAYSLYKNTFEMNRISMQSYQEILVHYDKKDWPRVYAIYENILKDSRIAMETGKAIGDTNNHGQESYLEKNLAYITYLKEHTLAYEDLDFPAFGLSFTSSMAQIILSMLITVCCIYLLSQIYTMDYAKDIDTSTLLPLGKQNVLITKIMMSMGISVIVFLLILLSSFFLASLFTFNTGLDYPFMMQGKQAAEAWVAVKLTTVVTDWIIIGILFYMNVCLFTYLLSLFIRADGALFLTAVCTVIGIAYMPTIVGYLGKIAHLLPTTYMNFANANISTLTGIQVLSTSIVLQFVVCILQKGYKKRG